MDEKNINSEEDFEEHVSKILTENLAFSMISFCFNILIDRIDEDNSLEIKKSFIKEWKVNASNGIQKVLSTLNERLKIDNVSLHNIINGNKIATPEDYQMIYNKSVLSLEKMYWNLCKDDDFGSGPKDYSIINNLK